MDLGHLESRLAQALKNLKDAREEVARLQGMLSVISYVESDCNSDDVWLDEILKLLNED